MGMTLQLLDKAGDQFKHDLLWLTVIIVSIAGALMTLYAVYIGYLFFTATDANRRKAAKDRAIKVVASTLIVFALVFVLQGIKVSFTDLETEKTAESEDSKQDYPYLSYGSSDSKTCKLGWDNDYESNEFFLFTGEFSLGGNDFHANNQTIFDPNGAYHFTKITSVGVVEPQNFNNNGYKTEVVYDNSKSKVKINIYTTSGEFIKIHVLDPTSSPKVKMVAMIQLKELKEPIASAPFTVLLSLADDKVSRFI